MNPQRCACNHCSCTVGANAVIRDGKAYCCQACASGHPQHQPCCKGECKCGEASHSTSP
ncbi:metallothionein [Pseudomonas sp. RHF3.3-3]|uniref:metallothionein n=1 Tax=Pseudomonas TaxID=286 RepID=UPI0009C09FAB|nr:metallothionein [Pseudomonas fuscovaginae]